MRICIIGSGLSGLSASFYLSQYDDMRITLHEQASVFGGRANVAQGGEHCARLFLKDYNYLFSILGIIRTPDGRSVFDSLRQVKRYCHTMTSGWVELSHLYPLLARELSLAERLGMAKARRMSPLLAEQNIGSNTNRYGARSNYSLLSLIRMASNLSRSKVAYALEGPTNECLIAPWVSHLEERGVELKREASVNAIRPEAHGVSIYSEARWKIFDAVIVAAFVSDVVSLLTASCIEHSMAMFNHAHCKCLTLQLDVRERVLASEQPALYCHNGINIVVQPKHNRCVVLCTRSASTDEDYVLNRVREYLNLKYELADVKVRDNQRAEEAIYAADYIDQDKILRRRRPHIYFAGSYITNSYPVDSGEGAVRSAFNVVQRMQKEYGLRRG